MEKYLRLNPLYQNKEERKKLFESLNRAPKQLDILLHFFQLESMEEEVSRKKLMEVSSEGN